MGQSTFEAVVNDWLGACLDASDVIALGAEARLGGVDLDDHLKLGLEANQLLIPEGAHRLALLNDHFFGVLGILEHLLSSWAFECGESALSD